VIVCTSCGYENEDTDAFCGSCAGFLEWEGQKVQAPEPEPVPEPEPRVDTERQGLVERVKEKIGLGEDTPTPDGAPASEQVPAPPAPLAERASAPPVVAPPVVHLRLLLLRLWLLRLLLLRLLHLRLLHLPLLHLPLLHLQWRPVLRHLRERRSPPPRRRLPSRPPSLQSSLRP
jgi:hypothetical protein